MAQNNSFVFPSTKSLMKGEKNPDQTVNDKQAMALYRKGRIDLQIAQHLNVSKAAVYRWRKSKGLKSNFKSKSLEVHGTYDYEQK